ncbi:RlmE family RNA methyltransferase [Candidatus Bathyarchaeota archaeon]|nr:RlmE family RNA methyltransferase [Candidatus Bathyarchaeota archaeon]MBL7080193.1 RlmE family RNA methyltransferase [Candidatus Bathyarchaeota archaeon]
MSKRWLSERRREHYHLRAKEEGYRSRSAFKLIQLDERFHFFNGASKVLDLGAAPGGWLQVTSEAIGEDGLILGVDLQEITPTGLPGVETLVGDVISEDTIQDIREFFQGKVDVILSDMAPEVSGVWDLDHFRQIHLVRVALVVANELLERDGWLVVKTFQGSEHEKYVHEVREMFERVKIVKPKASRKQSAEIFVVAHQLKSPRRLPEGFRQDDEES